jgi:thioredoxin-related protein
MYVQRRQLVLTGLAAAGALPFVGGVNVARGVEVNDDGLHVQSWFHESFLDMREDLQEATAAGKRLAVIWEQRGCPYCKEMHTVNLARPEITDFIKQHFTVLQLNLWGARNVTDFTGEELGERDVARKWRVNFTPTIMFFDKEAPDGKSGLDLEVARMPGYFKPFHFISMFEYVQQEVYKEDNFQRFLQNKFQELQAKGINPDVW